jgi:hypothetical protein
VDKIIERVSGVVEGRSWVSPRFLRLSISIKRTELDSSPWVFEHIVFATLRFQLLFVSFRLVSPYLCMCYYLSSRCWTTVGSLTATSAPAAVAAPRETASKFQTCGPLSYID